MDKELLDKATSDESKRRTALSEEVVRLVAEGDSFVKTGYELKAVQNYMRAMAAGYESDFISDEYSYDELYPVVYELLQSMNITITNARPSDAVPFKLRLSGKYILLLIAMMAMSQTVKAQEGTIVFTPQWTAQAQFAGYYVAEAKGFYREAGVKVRIEHPSATQPAMSRLRKNECQVTTLQLCQAMEIIDDGIPLVNILQTSMNNAMVIVSARGKDPLTQKGAHVGIWSVGFGQLAICMSIKEHLNYEWVRFAQNINLFVAGALDATLQ